MNKEILAEISALWDKVNDISRTLSNFTDMLNAQRKSEITENEGAILDEAETIDENNSAILDLAEVIEDLESRVEALEGGK